MKLRRSCGLILDDIQYVRLIIANTFITRLRRIMKLRRPENLVHADRCNRRYYLMELVT